jgi:hypothetical protein
MGAMVAFSSCKKDEEQVETPATLENTTWKYGDSNMSVVIQMGFIHFGSVAKISVKK